MQDDRDIMAENTVILRLDNVSKSFAKVEHDEVTHALNEVNLSMKSGEFISLVGPSGCGKSTILRLVAGLIPPTTGYLTVNGAQITGPSPERGMMFQKPTLFPWLTVEKNISFSLPGRGHSFGKLTDALELDRFYFPDSADLQKFLSCTVIES